MPSVSRSEHLHGLPVFEEGDISTQDPALAWTWSSTNELCVRYSLFRKEVLFLDEEI